MYETPRPAPQPFARNPGSIPLYVPPEAHLPLWPEAWRPLAVIKVFAVGFVLVGALAAIAAFASALS